MLNVSFSKGLDGHAELLCLKKGKVVGGRQKTKRILSQGTDEDALDLSMVVIPSGVSPVPPGLPQVDETGSPIAGSGKAGGVDEGLDEDDGMAVSVFPVGRKPMQAEGQHLRGQVGKTDSRKDEKAQVVGKIAQTPGPLGNGPSDHPVPVPVAPCGRSPSQEGDPLSFEKGDIADRLPGHGPESEVMVGPHLFVPAGAFGGFDGTDDQRVKTVPVQGVGVGRRIHGARIQKSKEKSQPFFLRLARPLTFQDGGG
jgi:hypothetical protein